MVKNEEKDNIYLRVNIKLKNEFYTLCRQLNVNGNRGKY